MPFQSVDNLSNLIPADVAEKLIERHIYIEELIKEVRRSSYRPQVVFDLCDDNKQIKVYLE